MKEGLHYYFNEQGLMVFTERYLRERGYCCDNGCKHCPYPKKAQDEELSLSPEQKDL